MAEPHSRTASSAGLPLAIGLGVTIGVALLSYALPGAFGSTLIGFGFLGATYVLVWRGSSQHILEHGLQLGGLFDPAPLRLKDVALRGIAALKWSALLAAICFPPFLVGFQLWYRPATAFSSAALWPLLLDVPTQVLMVALPEEAFYRGYLQTRLDKAWGARSNVFGARLGAGVVVSNLIFAVGHLLTVPYPGRLAVFFPGLAFGWLRAKTGGIGAALVFHALCNLFASYLGASYGLY